MLDVIQYQWNRHVFPMNEDEDEDDNCLTVVEDQLLSKRSELDVLTVEDRSKLRRLNR